MKKLKRKKLLTKIDITISEVLKKHNERRKEINASYRRDRSKSSMPLEHWNALQSKRKKDVT